MCVYLATVKSKGKRFAVGQVVCGTLNTARCIFEQHGIEGDVDPARYVTGLKMYAGQASGFRDLGVISEAGQEEANCIHYARRYARMMENDPQGLARILADPDYSYVRKGFLALGWPVE